MLPPFPLFRLRREAGGVLKVLLVFLILSALAGGGVWWFFFRNKSAAVTYQTLDVVKGDITQAVTATGSLNPVLNVQVGSQISGIVQKLFADFNSKVKAGQIVAQIDPATYKASLMQSEGDLANAKAVLELAQINERRTRELRKTNAAAQSVLDQTVATLHQAEAMVKVQEASLARAQADLQRCTIVSPIDGIVISRNVDTGQTVAASLQAPIIFLVANDLAKMQIDANVAEADVGNVEVDQDVEFTVDAFPYRTFHGKVTQVRNAAFSVQNVVSYDTVIEVHNDDLKLKPGMTANVSIIIADRQDVLKLGNAALRFRPPEPVSNKPAADASAAGAAPGGSTRAPGKGPGQGSGRKRGGRPRTERTIYVMHSGKTAPEPVQIKIGITDGIYTEVLSGLNEGDRVVVGMSGGSSQTGAPGVMNPFGGGPRRF